MNRRLLRIAVLMLAAAPVHVQLAQAQVLDTASQRVDLAGRAQAACVIAQPTVSQSVNASYSTTGVNSGQITISQLVDSLNATSLESRLQLDLPVTCNSSHRVVVRSANGGLVRTGASGNSAGSGVFVEAMNYNLGVDWNGTSRSLSSSQGLTSIDSAEPAKGDLTLNFSTSAGNGPLVAGQYTDSIVVEFTPAN